jgi:hypothetical protein
MITPTEARRILRAHRQGKVLWSDTLVWRGRRL